MPLAFLRLEAGMNAVILGNEQRVFSSFRFSGDVAAVDNVKEAIRMLDGANTRWLRNAVLVVPEATNVLDVLEMVAVYLGRTGRLPAVIVHRDGELIGFSLLDVVRSSSAGLEDR